MIFFRIFPHLALILLPFVFQAFLPTYTVIGWLFAFATGFFVKVFSMADRPFFLFALYAFLGGLLMSVIAGEFTPFALIFAFMILGSLMPALLDLLSHVSRRLIKNL